MKPKDKALELVRYCKEGYGKFNGAQSALIALIMVETILKELNELSDSAYIKERKKFWKLVEKEIYLID